MATEMRLILLDHALQAASFECLGDVPEHDLALLLTVRKKLKALHTVDAEPIRHGKWIRKYIPSRGRGKSTHKLVYVCDQCGRREPQPEPYCHCGAKMDGGNNLDRSV